MDTTYFCFTLLAVDARLNWTTNTQGVFVGVSPSMMSGKVNSTSHVPGYALLKYPLRTLIGIDCIVYNYIKLCTGVQKQDLLELEG